MTHSPVFDEDKIAWVHSEAIADPSGGVTVDVEARAVITALLALLRDLNFIAED